MTGQCHDRERRSATVAAHSAGRPLDPAILARMQARLGYEFSDVRIHTGAWAAASALAEGARAYTAGKHIVFGEDRYAPQTADGEGLLAHELAHVVQQTAGHGAPTGPHAAEAEARQAAGHASAGAKPLAIGRATPGGGIQRDELTDEERRRLAAAQCRSGRCHDPVQPSAFGAPVKSADRRGGPASDMFPPADVDAMRRWLEGQSPPDQQGQADQARQPSQQGKPAAGTADTAGQPLQVLKPPTDRKAPPGIAHLGSQRRIVHVVEVFVPETRFASPLGPWGSNRVLSQADVVARYDVEINQPDPTAGYNFDTYIWNITTKRRIPAQHLGGTRFRVLMGTPECPGCHLGRGLEVDLKGQSFAMVMAEGAMTAMAVGDMASMAGRPGRLRPPALAAAAEADEAILAAPKVRTPDDEFNDFVAMTRQEGATEFTAAGEPVTMQSHGQAREARQMLGVTGENQSMHGLPRSVGKHMPGYNPNAALTTLGERTLHTDLDQPWKDAFQGMRRQGRTTASAQEVYDAVADSIGRSSQLSPGRKDTLKLRLHDEMFVEYGLQPAEQMTLPYPNIKPRP
jgi:Domain of unknown function (DUF4157)